MSKVLSVSAISNYIDCPRKFYFQNILYKHRVGNQHFNFGTFAHMICELALTPNVSKSVIDNYIEDSLGDNRFIKSLEDLKIPLDRVYELVDLYLTSVKEFLEGAVVIGTELYVSDNDNRGIIDLLIVRGNKLIIVDWKFTSHPKTREDLLDNLQPYMYMKLINNFKDIKGILERFKITSIAIGYVSMSKVLPSIKRKPTMNKNGSISKVGLGATNYELYLETIEELGLDIADYEDVLVKLKNEKPYKVLNYIEMEVNKYQFERKLKDIISWNNIINYSIDNKFYPKCEAFKCSRCEIKKRCEGEEII